MRLGYSKDDFLSFVELYSLNIKNTKETKAIVKISSTSLMNRIKQRKRNVKNDRRSKDIEQVSFLWEMFAKDHCTARMFCRIYP